MRFAIYWQAAQTIIVFSFYMKIYFNYSFIFNVEFDFLRSSYLLTSASCSIFISILTVMMFRHLLESMRSPAFLHEIGQLCGVEIYRRSLQNLTFLNLNYCEGYWHLSAISRKLMRHFYMKIDS